MLVVKVLEFWALVGGNASAAALGAIVSKSVLELPGATMTEVGVTVIPEGNPESMTFTGLV